MAKTLNDFLNEHVNVFPSDVDEATRALIIQWFGYRQVAHSVFFPDWMMRTLDRDYPRYMELLRIEARTAGSEYDWLVTNYEERQVEVKNTDSNTRTSEFTTSRENERTFAAGTTEVVVDNDTDLGTGTINNGHTGTDTNIMTRDLTSESYSSENTAESTNNQTIRTPDLVNESRSSNNNTNRHGVIQRQAPMDMELAGNNASVNANVAHDVSQTGVDVGDAAMANDSHFMAGFPNLAIQNPTSTSDELSDTSDVTYNKTSDTGTEQTDVEGSRDVGVYGNEERSDTGTENNTRTVNLTDLETRNTTDTHTGRKEITRGGSDQDTSSMSGSDTKSDTGTSSHDGLERTIFTGRGGQSPQLLLRDAVSFIKETSAWKFLYRQIDKCFMMCYNLDEYEEV